VRISKKCRNPLQPQEIYIDTTPPPKKNKTPREYFTRVGFVLMLRQPAMRLAYEMAPPA
jgi:hypothetical protein